MKSRRHQGHQAIDQRHQPVDSSLIRKKPSRGISLPAVAGLILLAFFAGSSWSTSSTSSSSQSNQETQKEPTAVITPQENIAERNIKQQDASAIDNNCCDLYCTRPDTTTCCLACQDKGSEDTHEIIMALLEGLTIHIGALFTEKDYKWLRSRAWAENSHIGNRIYQGPFYFDWVRALRPNHICEIGFNGGHSGIIFLAATPRSTTVAAFDLQHFTYSQPGLDYVQKLYPGRLEMFKGSSFDTVPKYAKEHGRSCDIFSVDGDHSLNGAKKDLWNAIQATKVGGWIIMDDMTMQPRMALQQVYEESNGGLGNLHCLDDVRERVSHIDRYDNTTTFNIPVGWCWIQVLK